MIFLSNITVYTYLGIGSPASSYHDSYNTDPITIFIAERLVEIYTSCGSICESMCLNSAMVLEDHSIP